MIYVVDLIKTNKSFPEKNKRSKRVRIIGRLELISSKYEERVERFHQMKGFPKKISIS